MLISRDTFVARATTIYNVFCNVQLHSFLKSKQDFEIGTKLGQRLFSPLRRDYASVVTAPAIALPSGFSVFL
jgi:hypothetical protein